MTDGVIYLQIVLIFVFIILNGIFAASETALLSANENKVLADAEVGKKKAKKVLKFLKSPTRFLSTIQIGITMFGFLNGAIAANAFAEEFAASVLNQGWVPNEFIWLVHVVTTVIVTLVLTFVQVILGEIVPKRMAMRNPEKVCYTFIGFLSGIAVVMRPFVSLLTNTANLVVRMFGVDPHEEKSISEDEIRLMVNAGKRSGVIDESENEMIQNIFEFDTTTVSEVMTHRTELSAINVNTPKKEIIQYVTNEKFTRFPVYEESIDHIIGILHVKDLLKYIENPNTQETFDIRSLLRDPLFVPESKNTRQLFKEMQKSKVHIAIVIDEYGGTAGIVTFEDLIEEIVGNIFDEYDDEEVEIEEIKDDEYIIDGLTNIDDVEEQLNANLPVEEYDTLSGFILGQLGRFPEENEKIVIVYNNYRFEVLEYEDRVIGSVMVKKIETSDKADDEESED